MVPSSKSSFTHLDALSSVTLLSVAKMDKEVGHDHIDTSCRILTAAAALRLVSEFLGPEWSATKVEDVHLRPIVGGFCHRLDLISRNTPAVFEPGKILIRRFGRGHGTEDPLATSTTLSAAEQALVYYEMGSRGWGPKVYGIFHGGRLEEFVDSHPLTADESKIPSIRVDIARSYARLHSLELPLRRKNFTRVLEDFKVLTEPKIMEKYARRSENTLLDSAIKYACLLRDTDWSRELAWVGRLFETHDCRKTIAIGDANYLNILVKDCESDCTTMLIDYETATYSYRGIDIGGHFNERMYQWSDPHNSLTGHQIPETDERRSFCESYLAEAIVLREDHMVVPDTVDHLLLESEVGQLYQLMFSVFMGLEYEGPGDANLYKGLAHMLETYQDLKLSFIRKYKVDISC